MPGRSGTGSGFSWAGTATASTVRVWPALRGSLRERGRWSPSAPDRVCTAAARAAALKRARAQYPTRLGAFFSTTTSARSSFPLAASRVRPSPRRRCASLARRISVSSSVSVSVAACLLSLVLSLSCACVPCARARALCGRAHPRACVRTAPAGRPNHAAHAHDLQAVAVFPWSGGCARWASARTAAPARAARATGRPLRTA